MARDTYLTISGRLTADPELRFLPTGAAVANFTVATNASHYDKRSNEWVEDPPVFMRCNVWRQAAENVVESLSKGQAVMVYGRLKQRSFETREGDKRTVIELEVEDIGASLKFATVKINKVERDKGWNGSSSSSAEEYGDSGGNRGRSSGGQQRGNQASRGQAGGQRRQEPAEDPWGAAPPVTDRQASFDDDEPPF